jgi:hypothetical protein
MTKVCHKAQQDRVGAAYVLGQLVIWASGQKPTVCHEVRIEQWPFRIYPPQYQIVACAEENVVCPQRIGTYRTAMAFSVSRETFEAMGGYAMVHHRDGVEKVPVIVIDRPKEWAEERVSLLGAGGGELAQSGEAGGDVPFPFLLGDLFESGDAEKINFLRQADVGLHTATGYSNSFSFTEAFQNAVSNLPPDQNPYPDKMISVRVTRVGATYGGIAGLSRMYVTVASFY